MGTLHISTTGFCRECGSAAYYSEPEFSYCGFCSVLFKNVENWFVLTFPETLRQTRTGAVPLAHITLHMAQDYSTRFWPSRSLSPPKREDYMKCVEKRRDLIARSGDYFLPDALEHFVRETKRMFQIAEEK